MTIWVSIAELLSGGSCREHAAGVVQPAGGVEEEDARGPAVLRMADVQPVAQRPLADGRLEADLLDAQGADVREPVRVADEGCGRAEDRAGHVVATGARVVPVRDRDPAEA